MKVKCVLCDQMDELDDHSLQAKRFRNHLISLYLCDRCNNRITKKTLKRLETGKFKQYNGQNSKNQLI